MSDNETPVESSVAEHPVAVAQNPEAVARQALADQRLGEVQAQLQQVQGQLGMVAGELTRRNQAEIEAQIAQLPPAERAERKAELVAQQLGQLNQQMQRQQGDQVQAQRIQYFERRSKELEAEINQKHGLDGEQRVRIADVPERIVSAGEAATTEWMAAEAENRKARRASKTQEAQDQIDDEPNSVGRQVRKALADAGVTGPVGARPASSAPVEDADFKRLSNQERSPRDFPMGKRLAALRALREQAYAQAGLVAPGR